MKKVLLLFLFLSTIIFGKPRVVDLEKAEIRNNLYYIIGEKKPFTGRFEARDYKGNLELSIDIKRGMFNGRFKQYYPNGKVKIDYGTKDGEMHGSFKRFHTNGKVRLIANYNMGKMDYVIKEYDENGKRKNK